ncbi:hypothetical protein AMJ83_06990 [candidate division WOR_3 bacterium SM23_42]|uniref:GON domain-containing protein n=1 Tax=candidate division WOR_3 bacterium SM23_42 TaxID=1703779 RepID=A0A0S8FT02_UNCW3|nr:MAG: hypothetical protein AMJ83_06990 [candidate division WOR_3 bacterium SM23_42]
MEDKKELLAYCGLYCGDCGGYDGAIADKAQKLKETLDRFKFHRTAKHFFPKDLKDYDKLYEMLSFITTLRCSKVCRHKTKGETKCEIRKCCTEKGFYACHECNDFETCDKIKKLTEPHGDAPIKNLRAIKEVGIEDWINKAKRFWFADDE